MESAELHDNYTLVVAGSGQLGFECVADEKNVVMINRYIKDSEVAYLYKHAHCVVYPYISATQSGVLSLAFYYQTPVLVSDVPFFKSVVEHSGTGLIFKNGNIDDLKKQLLNLVHLDSSMMRKNQKTYYENYYEGSSIHESLLDIYSRFCN